MILTVHVRHIIVVLLRKIVTVCAMTVLILVTISKDNPMKEIELNEQQADWLKEFLQSTAEEECLSKASGIIVAQIITKLEN